MLLAVFDLEVISSNVGSTCRQRVVLVLLVPHRVRRHCCLFRGNRSFAHHPIATHKY